MKTFKNIIFTDDTSAVIGKFLKDNNYTSIAILVDENTWEYCYPHVNKAIPEHTVIKIRSGEQHKHIGTCNDIWQKLTEEQFDRKSLLINLGGGVIGDMGGFCARTYKRGIDFVNIPTTLLAQVDANVGGKLGIDFNNLKNHIGLFSDPDLIIIDDVFLKTLPERELKSGFAEVIKHHLIADNAGWQELSTKGFNELDFSQLVPHSVRAKQNIVDQDPRENGMRKILNFGHTIGHGIESHLLGSGRHILHGEGVVVGMICETFISRKKGLISEGEKNEIISYLTNEYPKVKLTEGDIENIEKLARQDKKNKGNKTLAALISGIGNAVWDEQINAIDIQESLEYYMHQT